jgi:hypothetical protein
VAPVWFVVLDRRINVGGQAHTKKFARIRRDPRVDRSVSCDNARLLAAERG